MCLIEASIDNVRRHPTTKRNDILGSQPVDVILLHPGIAGHKAQSHNLGLSDQQSVKWILVNRGKSGGAQSVRQFHWPLSKPTRP